MALKILYAELSQSIILDVMMRECGYEDAELEF